MCCKRARPRTGRPTSLIRDLAPDPLALGRRTVGVGLHPCFPGGTSVSGSWPTDSSYYDERWWTADGTASSLRRQVGANHRTLSTYINTLRRHHLWLDAMIEPEVVTAPVSYTHLR